MKHSDILRDFEARLAATLSDSPTSRELHEALGAAVMSGIAGDWKDQEKARASRKKACYLSAEFLVGRAVYNNLLSLGVSREAEAFFREKGLDFSAMEEVPDPALGNGGLGRLAACYLDSAAARDIPLDGYGIRYRYGLFRQSFPDGLQREEADDWGCDTDPWSVRREALAVEVSFSRQTVRAVPYDMPVIGAGGKIGRLRLWQAEPLCEFDFPRYRREGFPKAVADRAAADEINALLYPDDSDRSGKVLRLKQEYFFADASLKDMLREYKENHGPDFTRFPDYYAVQLNDTHPVVAIPDFLRLLASEYGYSFDEAFDIASRAFSYTNHTVMPEALEKWGAPLFRSVLPEVYEYVKRIDEKLVAELTAGGLAKKDLTPYRILGGGQVHMARMAVYAGSRVNGVSEIHTEILKKDVLADWHKRWPDRFVNVTNGITQRRWLALCNPALSGLITELLGSEAWVTDLERLSELRKFAGDATVIRRFFEIKQQNKRAFAAYLEKRDGISIDSEMLFDVQIKRMHEYKRQLLNAFGILDLYYGIKQKKIKDLTPTLFLFGGKAAPGYARAKGVIKFINEIAALVNRDPATRELMRVVFVPDYNVSAAEKIIPAAELSEQISTAGTEASGTGNMKLTLNGALTMGTYDGANIEIFREAGLENNYLFGARVEEIAGIKSTYNPKKLYRADRRLRKAVDSLINGTFDDGGSGVFEELHASLLEGASWHEPDHYFLFLDFESYRDTRLRAIRDYGDKTAFARKGFLNTAGAGKFSSDRSVAEYANLIWGIPSP